MVKNRLKVWLHVAPYLPVLFVLVELVMAVTIFHTASAPVLALRGASRQNQAVPASSAQSQKPGKTLRPVSHNRSKATCNDTRKGRVNCAAHVAVDTQDAPLNVAPLTAGNYGPAQFHTAYNLPCTPGGPVQSVCSPPGSFGTTVAIVVAGSYSNGSGTIYDSLDLYDNTFGLPACTAANGCLTVVNQSGATSPLPGPTSGWSMEIALDVEMVHAICQTCKIVLVEANDNSMYNLSLAVQTATTFHPAAINMSWGVSWSGTDYNSYYDQPGIALVAATGDSGSMPASWPAHIATVLAVAGTSLYVNADNTYASESVWSGSGGGCSPTILAPPWQLSLSDWPGSGCGLYRSHGDVSAVGDPNTGAYMMEATAPGVGSGFQVGGTSLAAPIISGIIGLAGKAPDDNEFPSVPYQSYGTSKFHDVTTGSDCTYGGEPNCTAKVGFDNPSGIGTPNGIGGFLSPPTTPSNLHMTTHTDSSLTFGWTASTSMTGVAGYRVYRNGTLIATQSSTSFTDAGLGVNTAYSYGIIAYDTAGIVSMQATASFSTDTDHTPPSAPTGVSLDTQTDGSISFHWTASTDNVGVAGYKIYRNGTLLSSQSGTSFNDTGLAPSSTYSYAVEAYDALSNVSAQATASFQTLADQTPPSVPSNFSASNRAATGQRINWIASTDNTAVSGYEVYRDSTLIGDTTVNYFDDTNLQPLTSYSYTVLAYDPGGHRSALSSPFVSATVADTTPPAAPTNLQAASVGYRSLVVSWDPASDDVGTTGYRVYMGGALVGSTATTSLSVAGLSPNTSYDLTVVAVDAANNASVSSATLTVTTVRDSTNPVVAFSAPSSGAVSGQAVGVTGSATDDDVVQSITLSLDGAVVQSATTSINYTLLLANVSNGTHTLAIKATDASGNTQTVSRSITVSKKTGDVNSDGQINIFDLSQLLSNYNKNYAPADFDGNGIVNIFDLSALLTHYGK